MCGAAAAPACSPSALSVPMCAATAAVGFEKKASHSISCMLGGPLTHTHSGDARLGGAHAVDMTAMASSSIHTPATTASSLLATLRFKRTAMEQHWGTALLQCSSGG